MGYAMTSDKETFRHGATAYRNSKNWTKEKRDEFIKVANGRVVDLHTASASLGHHLTQGCPPRQPDLMRQSLKRQLTSWVWMIMMTYLRLIASA